MGHDETVIDDLAHPRLPEWFAELQDAVGIPADRPLNPDELLTEARDRDGRDDFGDDWFREPFEVLVGALESGGELSPFGRFSIRELLVGLLITRLRLAAVLERHPEVVETPVESPIVILGLPRTGTTHLHNLLSADPGLRWLPYWESMEPIAPGDGRPPADGSADPRVEQAELGLTLINTAMPLFPAMHEMTPTGPHEEIQLLAADFATMLFEASYDVPDYVDWYRSHDLTHAYRTLKQILQACQFLRPVPGATRWLLKSPQHLEQLGPLLEVFPDARIVFTHRDPVAVTASLATMCSYSHRLNYATVDPGAIGPYWQDRIGRLLSASLRDRALVPEGQVLDVRFGDYMADQWRTVESAYDLVGRSLTPAVRGRTQGAMDANPRGKHGRIAYRMADVGLDADRCREALRFYSEAVGVEREEIT